MEEKILLPNLYNPTEWEAWRFVDGQERLSSEALIALLPLPEPIACWRAAIVLISLNRYEEAKRYLLQAQLTNDLDIDVAAKCSSALIHVFEA